MRPLRAKRKHPCGDYMSHAKSAESTDELDDSHFTALGWLEKEAEYAFYRDDGQKSDPVLEQGLMHIRLNPEGENLSFRIETETTA